MKDKEKEQVRSRRGKEVVETQWLWTALPFMFIKHLTSSP